MQAIIQSIQPRTHLTALRVRLAVRTIALVIILMASSVVLSTRIAISTVTQITIRICSSVCIAMQHNIISMVMFAPKHAGEGSDLTILLRKSVLMR